MSFLDHTAESEFPFAKAEVLEAMRKAIPMIKGMKIDHVDKLQGRIMVKSGVSWFSWGENIPIQLISSGENLTRVQITSTPKTGLLFGGATDLGKNRKNLELILNTTSQILSSDGSSEIIVKQIPNGWYEKSWLTILLCFVFAPVGIYGLWRSHSINFGVKIVMTCFIAWVTYLMFFKA